MNAKNLVVTGSSVVEIHRGHALLRAANEYPTIREMLLEIVQNSIDAGAKVIRIMVLFTTNDIVVTDDGEGVSLELFNKALSSVECSIKTQGKYGRFGIGLIAPLGKCEEFTFTSCPAPETWNYLEWSFRTGDIAGQVRDVNIPYREREDIVFDPKAAAKRKISNPKYIPVDWRTQVHIKGFSKDRAINRLSSDELGRAIVQRYRAKMLENNVKVSIRIIQANGKEDVLSEVRARQYQGKPLPMVVVEDADAGKVWFQLHLASPTARGYSGTVVVGEMNDNFRFPFKEFAINNTSVRDSVNKEVLAALKSGIFEGEITGENIKLNSSRKSFAHSAALLGYCAALERWYEEHGKVLVEEIKQEKKDQRFQHLGLKSLETLKNLLQLPQFTPLLEVIYGFQCGSIGDAHADPDDPDSVVGSSRSKSAEGGKRKGGKKGRSPGQSPKKDHPKHLPMTVNSPDGKVRRMVKNSSLGLQLCYLNMDDDRLWHLDTETGTLFINTGHMLWKQCENKDRHLMQLQELVVIQALTLHAMPVEWRETAAIALQEELQAAAYLMTSSPSFSV